MNEAWGFSDEEAEHIVHLAGSLARHLSEAAKQWCLLNDVEKFTPAVVCGALLELTGTITSNAHAHYGGPDLKFTVKTFKKLWGEANDV